MKCLQINFITKPKYNNSHFANRIPTLFYSKNTIIALHSCLNKIQSGQRPCNKINW